MKKLLTALVAVACLTAATAKADNHDNTVYMDLKDGRVTIELRPDLAPKHAARIKELVGQKFYDGTVFHRVIEGFMAQGGDPTGTGTGGSGQNIAAEFTPEPFTRGTVGMARSASPNSADSQFFIVFADTPHLNGQYTVVGKVTEGMEAVDKIARGEPPMTPDKIIKMELAKPAAPVKAGETKTEVKKETKVQEKTDATGTEEVLTETITETTTEAPVSETPAAE